MPADTAADSFGFIGLGRMGGGMAANLARAGLSPLVHDTDARAIERVTGLGARAAHSAAEVAARVTRLFLCLPFAPEVRAVMFGAHGVASGATGALHVVDCTTLIRSDALQIAATAREHGIVYNDCPVSGGPQGAEDGTLTIMFGGEMDEFAAAKLALDKMGREIIHCGPVGSGQLMKAVNNVIYDINIAAICELLPLAAKAGLDVQSVARVVTSGSSRSFASGHFVPRILEGRFEADFPMGAAWKDIVNVQEIALQHGAMTPVMNAMTAIYQTAIAQGHQDEPKSAMIKVYERILGLTVRSS
jgi:3-hydroxyisobutyrate dehydrogenase-like beta-hydroxyacid dehydrogenase